MEPKKDSWGRSHSEQNTGGWKCSALQMPEETEGNASADPYEMNICTWYV
jgi:hypothetical protein